MDADREGEVEMRDTGVVISAGHRPSEVVILFVDLQDRRHVG